MVHKCAYSEFHFPMHENARFPGLERKNEHAVQEKGLFLWTGPGYLLYLHDLGVILSMTLPS